MVDIAFAVQDSPGVVAYPFSSGYGTKYSAPASTMASANDCKFGSADLFAGGAGSTTGAWPWTGGTGFGTRYSDPATTPNGASQGVGVSSTGADVAYSCGSSPFVYAYPFTHWNWLWF